MRKVLVTGASGFVGGHIVRALQLRGVTVRCLVRRSSCLDFLQPLEPEVTFGDITRPETLPLALEGIDGVVHCAGVTKARSRAGYFLANEGGTRNLYAACRECRHDISRIVHLGSLAAFGPSNDGTPVTEASTPHPVSHYGESKLSGQRLAQSFMNDLPISIVAPPAVFGPNDGDLLVYFRFARLGLAPLIGKGDRTLSLIYAEDLAGAVSEVLFNQKESGGTYLVDDGAVHTWTEVAGAIGRALNRSLRTVRIPVTAVAAAGIAGDVVSRLTGRAGLISSQKVRELRQRSWTCSSRRIREELGFRPRHSLEQGIRETLAWYRSHGWM